MPTAWQAVGTIDSSRETDVWRQVQTYLGLRAAREPRSVGFYLDGDPGSAWVQAADPAAGQRFRLAIEVSIDRPVFLVSVEPAEVAHLARREPEGHPGLLVQPVFVGVRLRSGDQGLFRRIEGER